MPRKGTSKWPPYVKVAKKCCWSFRGALHALKLDWQEVQWEIMPALIAADRTYDGRGNWGGFMWLCAKREVLNIVRYHGIRRKQLNTTQLRSDNQVADTNDSFAVIEVDDLAEFALAAMRERDRKVVRRHLRGSTFKKISSRMGVTKVRCQQLSVRGIKHASLAIRKEALRVGSYANEFGFKAHTKHPGS